jgi:2-methylcitrate synthase
MVFRVRKKCSIAIILALHCGRRAPWWPDPIKGQNDDLMSETTPPSSSSGLRGQSAGSTAICTVGKAGVGLTYRGYDIEDLAEQATFEEVAFLLLEGTLPKQQQLAEFKNRLRGFRFLPPALKEVLERIPKNAHPMDVLRTGTSMAGVLEPEGNFSQQDRVAERLLASLPSMLCYWYRFTHDEGSRIELDSDEESLAAHFLTMLHGAKPSPEHQRCMDVSLILYAEHEFNASTFTARVCAATLSDFYSCVTGAIGTLRGPLHGGRMRPRWSLFRSSRRRNRPAKPSKKCWFARRRSWGSATLFIAILIRATQ